MTLRRPRAAAALVAAALVAILAAGASAATSAGGVAIAESPVSNFPDMAFAVSLPRDQSLSASQVTVTENGQPVRDVTVSKPGAENQATILAIDASDSMSGKPIQEAMAAARAFAARRNAGQQLAVVAFNDKVTVVLPLTADAASIDKALATIPPLATGTHIYDALKQAATMLQDAGIANGSIVLLSDGRDVGSTVDQAAAIKAVNDARARVFAVGLRSPQYEPDALRAIVAQTSGTYSEASSAAALSEIYSELGYTLSHEYLLRYRSLAGPSARMVVAVKVAGIPGVARATYTTPALAAPVTAKSTSTWDKIIRSPLTLFLVVLGIVSMLGYAIFRVVYRPDRALTRRIGQFVTLPQEEQEQLRQEDLNAAAAAAAGGAEPPAGWVARLEDDLEIAGIETPVRTIGLMTVVGGLVLAVLAAALLGSAVGLLAFVFAPLITRSVVNRRVRQMRQAFADQLPENLDVISSGLRSGHSFTGALAVCVDDAREPSRSEFRRVIADEQLGVPIDEALHRTGQRMQNRDLTQVALVARLQREAGTNAADVLDQVGDNVRARLELRRLVRGLTAQGRMARWIVSLLPVFLFVGIFLINRDYLRPLWTEAAGVAAMIVAAVMIVLGSLIIKRIVDIEA